MANKDTIFSPSLISALKKSVYSEDTSLFQKVNSFAIKAGYLVEPNACSKSTLEWVKEQSFNPNSTFYKSWQDISSRGELELLFNQLVHYFSTYGVEEVTGEAIEDNGFTMNDNPPLIQFDTFKVIRAAKPKEIFFDLYGMLKSGIALSSSTVEDIVEFCKDYKFLDQVDLDLVQNKEGQALLAVEKEQLPKDEFGMLRVLMYVMTRSTMIVKSKEVIQSVKWAATRPEVQTLLRSINEEQMKSLSHIFLRYKPLFLAMKSAAPNTINRIRRLAIKNHKPLQVGFWEKCLQYTGSDAVQALDEAFHKVEEISNFKKIQLLESILYRKTLPDNQFYHIRNGKTYIRENYKPNTDFSYLNELYGILMDSLIKNIVRKYTKEDGTLATIKLPKNLLLVCPTSEKNFVGNIPSGSYVSLTNEDGDIKDLILGIYWRGEWGTQDFDLHYSSFDGNNYGWNSYHKEGDNSILFSGDMTRANPDAAENFFINGDAPDGVLAVYRYYSTAKDTKFKFFVATENPGEKEKRNYMVDPNNIKFDCMIETDESGEKQLACVLENRVYFTNESLSGGRIPNRHLTDLYKEALPNKLKSHIVLKDLLTVAGFNIVEENADIDLSELSKADLINFFSEK